MKLTVFSTVDRENLPEFDLVCNSEDIDTISSNTEPVQSSCDEEGHPFCGMLHRKPGDLQVITITMKRGRMAQWVPHEGTKEL